MYPRLTVLGQPALVIEGGSKQAGRGSPSRWLALLVYLRIKERDRAVLRSELAESLWRESEAEGASTLTRNALSELRQRLGSAIEVGKDEVLLHSSKVSSDYDDLLAVLAEPAMDLSAEMCSREFLQGWTTQTLRGPERPRPGVVAFGEPFIRWVERERVTTRDRIVAHLLAAAEAAAASGDWPTVASIATRVIDVIGRADALPTAWLLRARAAIELDERESARLYLDQLSDAIGERPVGDATISQIELLRSRAGSEAGSDSRSTAMPDAVAIPRERAAASVAVPTSERAGRRRIGIIAIASAVAAAGVVGTVVSRRGTASFVPRSAVCRTSEAKVTLVRHNYQLNSVLKSRSRFTKGWWLFNNGECTWGADLLLHFVRDSGAALSATREDRPVRQSVPPGHDLLIEIPMRAPADTGTASERWELRDAEGQVVPINGSQNALLAQVRVMSEAAGCKPGEASAYLVASSHVPNQPLAAGEPFNGTWTLRNDGGCAWSSDVYLARASAPAFGGPSRVALARSLGPGEVGTFIVPMRAPESRGNYLEAWSLVDRGGRRIAIGREPTVSLRLSVFPANEIAGQPRPPACAAHELRAGWVDESPLDSAEVLPGQLFEKSWTVSNVGTCRWDGLRLVFRDASRARMSVQRELQSGDVYPGATHSFVLTMMAPTAAGFHRETWRVMDANGERVLVSRTDTIWVLVNVRRGGRGPAAVSRRGSR